MLRKTFLAPLIAASAISLTIASPAYAGKEDRARAAIAAAEAKLQTAETMGAGTEMPEDTARARATLARAKEHLKADRNVESIDAAIQAQAMADTAIGRLQKEKDQALMSQQLNADSANQTAAMAQQNAADANARAAAAERSAASSAADAQAARTALAAQQAAEVETTVTTQQPAARATTSTTRPKTTVRRTVKRTASAAAPATTTTTTVKQTMNP